MNKSLIVLSAIALLSGCSNEHTESVKALDFEADDTFTIGQALSNRQICDDSSWDQFEDERGRLIVEYRCLINGAEDVFEERYEEALAAVESKYEKQLEDFDQQRQSLEQRIAEALASEAKEDAKIAAEIADIKAMNLPPEKEADAIHLTALSNAGIPESTFIKDELANEYSDDARVRLNTSLSTQRLAEVDELESQPSDAVEVHQWTIKKGKPIFLAAGIEYSYRNKPEAFIPFQNMWLVNKLILDNEVASIVEYFEECQQC